MAPNSAKINTLKVYQGLSKDLKQKPRPPSDPRSFNSTQLTSDLKKKLGHIGRTERAYEYGNLKSFQDELWNQTVIKKPSKVN